MALVLAIEPDLRQAAVLKRIIRERVKADLVVVDSRDAAMESLHAAIPDVLLLSALLSPRDEDELIAHLRGLDGAEHLQTHTIPQLASTSEDGAPVSSARGLLKAFRRKSRKEPEPAMPGCDPDLFAGEIRTFLKHAAEKKEERRLVVESGGVTHDAGEMVAMHGSPHVEAPPEHRPAPSSWESPFEWRSSNPSSSTANPSSLIANPVSRIAYPESRITNPESAHHEPAAIALEAARLDVPEPPLEPEPAVPLALEPAVDEQPRVEMAPAETAAEAPADFGFAELDAIIAVTEATNQSPDATLVQNADAPVVEVAAESAVAEHSQMVSTPLVVPVQEVPAASVEIRGETRENEIEEVLALAPHAGEARVTALSPEPVIHADVEEGVAERTLSLVAQPEITIVEPITAEETTHALRASEPGPEDEEIEVSLSALLDEPESAVSVPPETEASVLEAGPAAAAEEGVAAAAIVEAPVAYPRLGPLATWVRAERPVAVAEGPQTTNDELRALLSRLAVPPQVANVAYPRGCRIRRVRVPAAKDTRKSHVAGPVILSRKALDETRLGR